MHEEIVTEFPAVGAVTLDDGYCVVFVQPVGAKEAGVFSMQTVPVMFPLPLSVRIIRRRYVVFGATAVESVAFALFGTVQDTDVGDAQVPEYTASPI